MIYRVTDTEFVTMVYALDAAMACKIAKVIFAEYYANRRGRRKRVQAKAASKDEIFSYRLHGGEIVRATAMMASKLK